MKKRMVIPLIFLYLMLGIIIMNLVNNDYYVEERDISFTTDTHNEEVLDLTEERVFVFKNPLLHVENMILKFSGCENLTNGFMYVRVFDDTQEYYTYEVPVYAFSSHEFYLYTNEIAGLQAGEEYKISVLVTDEAAQKIQLHCSKDRYFNVLEEKSDGKMVKSNSPLWGADGRENYSTFNGYQWLVIGVCITLFYGCVVYLWCTRKNVGLTVCFMLVILTVGTAFLYGNQLIIETPVEYWSAEKVQSFEHVPMQEGVEQSFVAEYDSLQEFILFLDHYLPEDSGVAQITLYDGKGENYYLWEAPITALTGEVFCLVGKPVKELKAGEEYFVKACLTEGESGITVRTVAQKNIRSSMRGLLVAGEESQQVLYLHQNYIRKDSYLFLWGMILGITLVFVLLIRKYKDDRWMKVWYGLCEILLICAGYYMIESLSGNLKFVEPANAFRNGLLISSVYLVLKTFFVRKAYYISGILCLLIGLTNFYVLEFRGTELLYTDIKSFFTAMSVANNYRFVFPPAVFTALLIMACLFVLRIVVGRMYPAKYSRREKIVRGTACIMTSMMVVLVLSSTLNRSAFDFFHLSNSFRKFGWCYTNLYLMRFSDVDKPEGYSEEAVERIIQEVADEEWESPEIIPENIIVIMNESFADLQSLGNLETNQDYMPFIRSLEENVVKGEVYVPTFGGGTSLTEYEFLTGNLQHFLPQSTVPYSSLCKEQEEGLCSTLKAQGYYTVAMHPYDPTNWNRHKVYPAMGFDEFVDLEDYEDAELIRNFVSDKACYDKIIEYYEDTTREGGLFCFNVTMQNHGGYDSLNGVLHGEIEIENIDNDGGDTYLSLIYESDKAFAYLLEYFEQVEEPTMILMFGDHLPALSDEFYEQLYGKAKSERSLEEKCELFGTPYILWTNYDSDFQDIPRMSVNYLGSYLLQCAGVNMPLYNQFLMEYQKAVPALGVYGILDEEGNWVKYKDVHEEVLQDYKILQYMRLEDRKSLLYSIFQSY